MKKIYTILLVIIINIVLATSVNASSANISVSAAPNRVVVGGEVRVTITVSSSQPLGSWDFNVNYDRNRLELRSSTLEGSTSAVNNATNGNTRSRTYTMVFRARTSGTANVSVSGASVWGWNEQVFSVNRGSTNINIQTQAEINASRSNNNNLRALSVTNHTLTPVFNANTLEYSLEVENEVESITIAATADHNRASISGTGQQELLEGNNKFEVIVTAENGNRRIYVINVIRQELDPIIVSVGDRELTVVRRSDDLDIPQTFTETKTTINDEEVPAFESEILKIELVALRDEDGNIGFYIHKKGDFSVFIFHQFGNILLHIFEASDKDIPSGFTLKMMDLGFGEIPVYVSDKGFPLIYGTNMMTGETGFYSYDEHEDTLQRFMDRDSISITEEIGMIGFITLGAISILSIIGIIIVSRKRRKLENPKIEENDEDDVLSVGEHQMFEEESKGKAGIIVTIILILALIGGGIFLYLNNDDSDDPEKDNNGEEKIDVSIPDLICTGEVEDFNSKYLIIFGDDGEVFLTMELDVTTLFEEFDGIDLEEFEETMCDEFDVEGISCMIVIDNENFILVLIVEIDTISEIDFATLFDYIADFTKTREEIKEELEAEGFVCN